MIFIQYQISIIWRWILRPLFFTFSYWLRAGNFLLRHEEWISQPEVIWTFLFDSHGLEFDKAVEWTMEMGMVDIESAKKCFDDA